MEKIILGGWGRMVQYFVRYFFMKFVLELM